MLQELASLGGWGGFQGDGDWWACLVLFSIRAKLLLLLPKALFLAFSFLSLLHLGDSVSLTTKGPDAQKGGLSAGPACLLHR